MSELKEIIDKVSSTLVVVSPFISSLLRKARIIAVETPEVPIAATDIKHNILINKKTFPKLKFEEQAFVIAHEVIHTAFSHVHRGKNKHRVKWNVCADAVTNSIVSEMIRIPESFDDKIITYNTIHEILESRDVNIPEDFYQMSPEELYKLIPDGVEGGGDGKGYKPKCPMCGSGKIRVKKLSWKTMTATFKCGSCGHEWTEPIFYGDLPVLSGSPIPVDEEEGVPPPVHRDLEDRDFTGKGKVVKEGDEELYKGSDEDREEKWKEEVFKAYTVQKTIGNVPAGLKRIVDKLFKPKIPWQTQLRNAIKEGLGRTVVNSWTRLSRKVPYNVPGIKRYTIPTVWTLVDTSGSIGKRELWQFFTEIYAIAGMSDVKVVCWDSTAYETLHAKSKSEVVAKVMTRIRGGGGTVISPALEKTLKEMRTMDIVVVFTDGYIYDINDDNTRELFEKVAMKSSKSILVTTGEEHIIPRWVTIKLQA